MHRAAGMPFGGRHPRRLRRPQAEPRPGPGGASSGRLRASGDLSRNGEARRFRRTTTRFLDVFPNRAIPGSAMAARTEGGRAGAAVGQLQPPRLRLALPGTDAHGEARNHPPVADGCQAHRPRARGGASALVTQAVAQAPHAHGEAPSRGGAAGRARKGTPRARGGATTRNRFCRENGRHPTRTGRRPTTKSNASAHAAHRRGLGGRPPRERQLPRVDGGSRRARLGVRPAAPSAGRGRRRGGALQDERRRRRRQPRQAGR